MSRSITVAGVLAPLALAAHAVVASTVAQADPVPPDLMGPAVPAIADINGDGVPDVVFSDYLLGGGVSVFLGKPGGGLRPAVHYATGGQADYVAIADFDHDGTLDLAVTNFASSDVSILLGHGDGTFAAAVDYATDFAPGALVAADFDHDGNLDIATSNQAPSWSFAARPRRRHLSARGDDIHRRRRRIRFGRCRRFRW